MSSFLSQGLCSNYNLKILSSPSHEEFDVKRKKSGKRKNLLNRYGASKRRKLGSSLSRKQVLLSEQDTHPDSSLKERYSVSNTALSSCLNCDIQASQHTPEYDEYSKSGVQGKHPNSKGLELCTDLVLDNRIMACSQAAELGNAELLCSSSKLRSTSALEPLSNLACDRRQGTSESRVLRPRRVRNKEIKESSPSVGDSALIIGRRIEVYWPLDAAWYCGLISAYDNIRKKHKVCYDDGEEEWLYLAQERFKYEVPSKSEWEQISGNTKDTEVVKDGKDLSALPSSSPQHNKGISNSSQLSTEKLTSEFVNSRLLQGDTTVSNTLFSESALKTEATDLNSQKCTEFSPRKHKDSSVRSGKSRTVVNGSNKAKGSLVYGTRQRCGLKGRSRGADQRKTEATKRAQSLKGQNSQGILKDRKKQKPCAEDFCKEGLQRSKKLASTRGNGDVGGSEEVGHPNYRKRKQRSSNDEAGTPRAMAPINAGVAVHCSTGELDKRVRKRQKVKSLAHTALATEELVTCTVQDTDQTLFVETAMINTSNYSELPRQNHTLLYGDTNSNFVCDDKQPPPRTRENCMAGNSELGLNKRLGRRKPKSGSKYIGFRSRGRGHLRRQTHLSASMPSNRRQGEIMAVDRDSQFVMVSYNPSFDQEKHSSIPLSSTKASLNCKCVMGAGSGSVSSVKVGMIGPALEGNLFHMSEQHCSMLDARIEQNGSGRSCLRAFFSTVCYPRRYVVSDLFTRQLFNIFEAVGLSGGSCFEGKFWWMGSTRDLANIVLLFMFVVKSLLSTSQKCHQCWQGRVLHEFWSVLSRKEEWSQNLPAALSPQADGLLMQHVRQLISGHSVVNMTSRQMLNIFSSYILKPYIVAVLCEKGAQLRVVMQQYLVSPSPLKDGISFKRQFVSNMELRSHAGAEADFVACLMLSPLSALPFKAPQSSERLIESWSTSTDSVGHAQLPIPMPSFKLSRNKDLQFTTASIFSRETATRIGQSAINLEQTSDTFGVKSWRLASLSLPREAGDFLLHASLSCFHEFQKLLGLHTGLCFKSMLQKLLDSAGGRRISSGHILKKLLIKVDCAAKGGRVEGNGWEQKSHLNAKRTDIGFFDNIQINQACLNSRVPKEDASGCMLPLPERNITVNVKEEYSWLGHPAPFDKGATPSIFMGSSPTYSLNDFAYSASGSSSSSGEECNKKWKTTKMAVITSRPDNAIGRKGIYVEAHCRTPELHLKRRAGSKCRPRGFEQENVDMKHLELSCTANILLSNNMRSWREFGVRVELQSRKSVWVISVQAEGAVYSHKVVESTLTSKLNRYTHAMMWKGGDGWTLEFCDRRQWIHFKQMHEECGHRNARAAFIKQIPIPCVKQIEQSSQGRSSDTSFSGEQWPGEVEYALDCSRRVYDVDSEDEKWLIDRSQRMDEKVSIDVFERIIDKLERVTYLRQSEMVAQDEVTGLCDGMASEKIVLSVYQYWSEKRTQKDNALIRYFELPLPKKYQKQLDNWKQRMEELEERFPNATKEELQGRFPEPPLFAFCWPSRGLDADNVSKRLQRQRSQKHLNSLKYTRMPSFETSDLQRSSLLRSQRVHDSHWYQVAQRGDYWQRRIERDGFSEHLVEGSRSEDADHSSLYEARATATAARQLALLYLLRFDSALQRAVAAIMDFETTYASELALMNESATMSSYDYLLSLKKRINRVLNQFASLTGKEDLLEQNLDLDAYSDDNGDEHDEDDSSWTVGIQEDGFRNSSFSLKEDGTFLSISERAHLEAWMRSTLRQRAC